MAENLSFNEENSLERQRLIQLLARISERDLTREMANGRTLADTLVHLAFWDFRQLAVLRQWKKSGVGSFPIDVRPLPNNVWALNEAVAALANNIPPREASPLALKAAEAIDGELEKISPELVEEILGAGQERILRRSLHRREHLDKIEKTMREQPGP